jgi:hypothetical protein
MPGGGGHDSLEIAVYLSMAMLIVPSTEDRSHSTAECTMQVDVARGGTGLATGF